MSDNSGAAATSTYVLDLILEDFDVEIVFAACLPPIIVFLVDLDAICWSLAQKDEFVFGIHVM